MISLTNYFSLVRHGIINLKGLPDSQVQCAGVKHQFYKYGVGILYAEGLKLDNNGWLIDNNAIDAVVQNTQADSCEKMLIIMRDGILKLLEEAQIPFVGMKILLRPFVVTDEKVAEFCINVVVDKSFLTEVMALEVGVS